MGSIGQFSHKEDNYFYEMTDNAPVMIWRSDAQGKCVYVNRTWLEFRGRKLPEELGDGYQDGIHPDDLEVAFESFLDALAKGEPFTNKYRILRADGSYRWVENRCVPLGKGADFRGYIGVCADITENKAITDELRGKEAELRALVSSLDDVVLEVDAKGYVVGLWTSKEVLPCRRLVDIVGRHLKTAFLSPVGNMLADAVTTALSEKRATCEFQDVEHPGHWWHAKVTLIRGQEDLCRNLSILITDITERRRSEAALRNTELALIQSSKMASLGEMAGGIAHEINNPLAVIHGNANILKKLIEYKSTDIARIKECSDNIVQTAERISQVIKGLRDFSREDANEPIRLESVADITQETLALCRERIRNHGIELRVDPIHPDIMIECHPVQISQVLLNLLNNAHDAALMQTERWIAIKVEDNLDEVVVKVIDSGHGIAPRIQEKMMQPFFSTKPAGMGTGLGLSISRRIIEDHHGKLVYDEKAGNTTFAVHLPAARKPSAVNLEKAP